MIISDEELMQRVARGEQEAFSQLYDRYSDMVLGLIYKITSERRLSGDLLQETFWRVWEKANTFDSEKGKFTTWMYSIARRQAIDSHRRRQARPPLSYSEDAQQQMERLPSSVDVPKNVQKIGEANEVRAALDGLPAEQREVIQMAYFEGKTRREIAAETDTPLGTVHTRARLALLRLRKLFDEKEEER